MNRSPSLKSILDAMRPKRFLPEQVDEFRGSPSVDEAKHRESGLKLLKKVTNLSDVDLKSNAR